MQVSELPMVDAISSVTSREVVIGANDKFVYLDTKTEVEAEHIQSATTLKAAKDKENLTTAINKRAGDVITAKYPLEKQSSANLGIYGTAYADTMKTFIQGVVNLSNTAIENNLNLDEFEQSLLAGGYVEE